MKCFICVEGSTFYQLKNYQERIKHYLDSLSRHLSIEYHFVKVEQASLTGAGIAGLQAPGS
jgi:hypothetical protein